MPLRPILRFALPPLAVCFAATAQTSVPKSALPATPPTAQIAATPVAPLNATPGIADNATRAHRADVRFANGLISINADNSSLNQILREIGRQTGMTITGGVREERVFGRYGPAAPADVLLTLLDGTGVNVLVQADDANTPKQLVLTQRSGGPTPPNPNAPGFDAAPEDDDHPQAVPEGAPAPPAGFPGQAQAPFGGFQRQGLPLGQPSGASTAAGSVTPANNVLGNPANTTPTASQIPTVNSVPMDSLPTPSTTQPVSQGIVDSASPSPATNLPSSPGSINQPTVNPSTGTVTTPSSTTVNTDGTTRTDSTAPDGTTPASTNQQPKTADDYFQMLQKMRQQNQKTPQS
jgi:hypothetical protein